MERHTVISPALIHAIAHPGADYVVADATAATSTPEHTLCPNVWTGCGHTMIMNEDGVGVGCDTSAPMWYTA